MDLRCKARKREREESVSFPFLTSSRSFSKFECATHLCSPLVAVFGNNTAVSPDADHISRIRELFGEVPEEVDQKLAYILCILRAPFLPESCDVVVEVDVMAVELDLFRSEIASWRDSLEVRKNSWFCEGKEKESTVSILSSVLKPNYQIQMLTFDLSQEEKHHQGIAVRRKSSSVWRIELSSFGPNLEEQHQSSKTRWIDHRIAQK